MTDIRTYLAQRLVAKGLEDNEIDLFIKDVIRNMIDSPWHNLATIKGQLHLLGWCDEYTDYRTLELIQACYLNS